MSQPWKLKAFAVFNDGNRYAGQVPEISAPKLERKIESYRAGDMNGETSVDLGLEKLEMEVTFGGYMRHVYTQWASAKSGGVPIRFAGSYQEGTTGKTMKVEITTRGRWQEIDTGSAKAGDDTEFKAKMFCNYYKLEVDGKTLVEVDVENYIEIIDGVDMLAEHRKNMGI